MKKRRDKKGSRKEIRTFFSNRWLYTLITAVIIIAIGIGIYAYGTYNPSTFGHTLSEIAAPSGCSSGQFLQYTGGDWTCASASGSSGESCPTGYILASNGVLCYRQRLVTTGWYAANSYCESAGAEICSVGEMRYLDNRTSLNFWTNDISDYLSSNGNLVMLAIGWSSAYREWQIVEFEEDTRIYYTCCKRIYYE
jgi:hypothetical protein